MREAEHESWGVFCPRVLVYQPLPLVSQLSLEFQGFLS